MSGNTQTIESIIDMNNRLFFTLNQIRTQGGTMEQIPGYDGWKLQSPQETITDEYISIIERNLKPCPFCGKRPCFEDSVDGWFVSCECGAQMPGDDPMDAAAKWSTRPKVENFREGPRAYWPGA